MQEQEHWDAVYKTKPADSVSWYQPSPEPSLRALDALRIPATASLIDVGGGASNLVDALLRRGWTELTVLDISAAALQIAKDRLGPFASRVCWEVADITEWLPERSYDVWHDRAVFHFLTSVDQRKAYRRALEKAVSDKGRVIIGTFAPDGPEKCSGLPVQQYDHLMVAKELGSGFRLLGHWREEHRPPNGMPQSFNWCTFERV